MERYKDKRLSPEERAEDLCRLMTIEEKAAQLVGYMPYTILNSDGVIDKGKAMEVARHGLGRITQFSGVSAIDPHKIVRAYNSIQRYMVEETRLGIPFMTQAECINGLVGPYGSPFPCPTVVAATFNKDMAETVGESIGEQNEAAGVNIGMFPTVDLSRDPRWGRITEDFGEDAYLTAVMATTEAKAFQKKPKLMCLAKHFLGFGQVIEGTNSGEIMVNKHTLREEHAYPWEAMFNEADVRGVMATYGCWNGVPVSVNKDILTGLLRNELGFKGSAICDGNSITQVHELNKIGENVLHTAALAIKAGLSADTPTPKYFIHLKEAVEQGYVTEDEVDKQVKLILEQKFRLGLFEDPYFDEGKVDKTLVKGHYDDKAKKVLREGIIMLQNKDNFLPLKKGKEKITVIGPFGNSFSDYFGGYTFPAYARMMWGMVHSQETGKMQGVTDANAVSNAAYANTFGNMFNNMSPEMAEKIKTEDIKDVICKEMYNGETIRDAVARISGKEVGYVLGTNFSSESDTFDEAIKSAENSDVVVLTLGENTGWGKDSLAGEGSSRSFTLPDNQVKLLQEVLKVNKKVILILIIGRPVVLPEEAMECKAIFNMWMPSAFGGTCIAEVLFGEVNPSGKLPLTMPMTLRQTNSYYSQISGKRDPLANGKYSDAPRFPFGYGLSYTKFEYSDLVVDEETAIDGSTNISVRVTNTGAVEGKEVVEVFYQLIHRTVARPIKQLVAFEKLSLKPGESAVVHFEVPTDIVAYNDINHKFGLEAGPVMVYVGGDAENAALEGKTVITGSNRKVDCTRKHFSVTTVERS